MSTRSHPLLGEGVVEGGDKSGDSGVRFVAHIGNSEGLALQFAITAVDDQLVAGGCR